MIIFVCCMRGSVSRIVRNAAGRSTSRPWIRWWIRSCACRSGTKIQLLAPVVRGRKGEHAEAVRAGAKRSGYVRVRVDGSVYELSEEIKLDKNKKHNIEIVVDRLVVKPGIEKRLTDSIENVLNLAEGLMTVDVIGGEPVQFSARAFPARIAGSALMRSSRSSFSFNNPFGACPECYGLGYKMEFDEDLMIPDKRLSALRRARSRSWAGSRLRIRPAILTRSLKALAKEYGFSLNTPYQELPGG